MRLRKTISSPDRFDEILFKTKNKDATKPSYPRLLAAQTVPFDPGNQPAIFPSLPLVAPSQTNVNGERTGQPAQGTFRPRAIELSSLKQSAVSAANDTISTTSPSAKDETGHKHSANCIGVKPAAKPDICHVCNKKVPVKWESLSLSVQIHIFNAFFQRQGHAVIAATVLKLSHKELEVILYQLNLRKIYNAPFETIWTYGAAACGSGLDVIDPAKITELMDYLIFAGRYEVADEYEIERGRSYLRQFGLEDEVLDNFRVAVGDKKAAQTRVLHPPNDHRPLKRRRKSMSDGPTTKVVKVVRDINCKSFPMSAPPSQTGFDRGSNTEQNGASERACRPSNHPTISLPLPRSILEDANSQTIPKHLLTNADDQGHGSITHSGKSASDPVNFLSSQSDAATIGRLQTVSLKKDPGVEVHVRHNPKAFAAHFNRITFPVSERLRLLQQDPTAMSHVDHWLVYGSTWKSLTQIVACGLVCEPSVPFNPQTTILEGRQLPSLVLRALIDLHNNWVRTAAWNGAPHGDLTRRFDLIAETVMEDVLKLQISGQINLNSDGSGSCRTDQSATQYASTLLSERDLTLQPDEILRDHHGQLESRSKRQGDDILGVHKLRQEHLQEKNSSCGALELPTNDNQPQLLESEFHQGLTEKAESEQKDSEELGMLAVPQAYHNTPTDRTTYPHTGDTTISGMGSLDSKSGSMQYSDGEGFARRKLFNVDDLIAANDNEATACPQSHLPSAENEGNAREDKLERSHSQAPSYTPISNQDPETLPEWSLSHGKNENDIVDKSSALTNEDYHFPYGRPMNADFRQSKILQDSLVAVVQNMSVPELPNITSLPSRSCTPGEGSASPTKPQLREGIYDLLPHRPSFTRLEQSQQLPESKSNIKPVEMSRHGDSIGSEKLRIESVTQLKHEANRDTPELSSPVSGLPAPVVVTPKKPVNARASDILDEGAAAPDVKQKVDVVTVNTVKSTPAPGAPNKCNARTAPAPMPEPAKSKTALAKKHRATPKPAAKAPGASAKASTSKTSKSRNLKMTEAAAAATKTVQTPVSNQATAASPPVTRSAAATAASAIHNGTKKRRKDFGVKRGSYKKRNSAVATAAATPTKAKAGTTTSNTASPATGGRGAQTRNTKK